MIKEMKMISKNGVPTVQIRRSEGLQEIPLTDGFKIHTVNEIMRSLKPDYFIFFRSWKQYSELVDLVSSGIQA